MVPPSAFTAGVSDDQHLGATGGHVDREEVGEPGAVARERTGRVGCVAVPRLGHHSADPPLHLFGRIGGARDPTTEVRRRAGVARRPAPRAAARPSRRSDGRRPGSTGRLPARSPAPAGRCCPRAASRRTRRRSDGVPRPRTPRAARPPPGRRGRLRPSRTRAGTTFCTLGTIFPSTWPVNQRGIAHAVFPYRGLVRLLHWEIRTRSGPTAGSQHAVHFVEDQAFLARALDGRSGDRVCVHCASGYRVAGRGVVASGRTDRVHLRDLRGRHRQPQWCHGYRLRGQGQVQLQVRRHRSGVVQQQHVR